LFITPLRVAFAIWLFTFVSYLVNRHRRKAPRFKILGTVPRGFKDMGTPPLNHELLVSLAKHVRGAVVVLLARVR
jgi:sodium-independent sulfate anion transporter 11